MTSLLRKMDEKYGGIEGYATQELEFSKEGMNKTRINLRADKD